MSLSADTLTIAGRLQAVSASFAPGTITAICGPNGAGKSTLLSAMAALVKPSGGYIQLDGADLLQMPPRERARLIGYLPQQAEIAWDVTVRNLVALGRLPYGDEQSQPVDAAIAALNLGDLADRPMSQLSGGERARALLARMFAGQPRWMLADEPLAALDLAHQLHLIDYLAQAAKAGAGVIIVLHDLALARNHADHVLVLDCGKLAAQGLAAQVLTAETIKRVWGVDTEWAGAPGCEALITKPPINWS